MSLYEALSLVVSATGTLATVYIGLRQLRPNATAPVPVPRGWPYYQPPPTRPVPVTAASLLLYTAAAVQPIVFVSYYGIRYAVDPQTVALEFGEEGYIDILGLGAIALVSALLGLFVARGSGAARAMVWTLAGLSAATLVLMCIGSFLAYQASERDELLGPFPLLFFGYVAIVCISYMAAGAALLPAPGRSYFRRR